ncbi:MAG: TolC family protein [Hyphomicrobium sp.]|uniref:TolC family protein n=1 Tax=Hyphomicrobium sp. TaxID=82 RepID=UPI0025BD6EF8|nr:TolC family protein [Hyphomicrobium sp.]MBZ0209250.1 TolC family protein [Hyphomicrobium sp.]
MTAVALCLAGCSTHGDRVVLSETLPAPATYAWRATSFAQQGAASSDGLTFREAIGNAVAFSPSVKAAYAEIDAKQGEALQASFRLNPELAVALPEVANNGGLAEEDSGQELQISQTLELGGKRFKRLAAADLETSLAVWDYEVARVLAASQAAEAFVDVLAAQDRLAILNEFVTVAEKTRSVVEARVKGGRASPIELDRAKVSVAQARALVEAERARLEAARRKLASLWGADYPTFDRARGRLGRNRSVPTVDEVKAFLEGNPTLARWADGIAHRYAVLQVEQSKAIPNMTVGLGVRRFDEDNSSGLLASLSVPLPIFDRNEGNIAAAERRIAKAEFDAQATRTQLIGLLIEALGALRAADIQARAIEANVLPAAQSAFDKTRTGYEEGKFDLLNVLDTQRTLFEARRDLINARAEFEKARVQVEVLIGRDLNER